MWKDGLQVAEACIIAQHTPEVDAALASCRAMRRHLTDVAAAHRALAKACEDYGQRVQNSVFECWVDSAQWVALRRRLISEIDTTSDSLRFYFLGAEWHGRVEHVGAKLTYEADGPLIL